MSVFVAVGLGFAVVTLACHLWAMRGVVLAQRERLREMRQRHAEEREAFESWRDEVQVLLGVGRKGR